MSMQSIHPVWLIAFAGLIAFAPIVTGLLTSYIKISVVLSMLRTGIGAQQVPGNLVVMALSLATTLYVMQPVLIETIQRSANVDLAKLNSAPSSGLLEDLATVFEPWRKFMRKHVGEREVFALMHLSADESAVFEAAKSKIKSEALPARVLVPAFVITELKEAFAMGFVLLLPFIVIDLIVANILAGMGMFMVSPMIISLPLKLILFVLADGWILLTRGLIASYQV